MFKRKPNIIGYPCEDIFAGNFLNYMLLCDEQQFDTAIGWLSYMRNTNERGNDNEKEFQKV